MKRDEILAVLTDHAKLWEGRGDIGYAGDLIAIRGVIASALDDAERFKWRSIETAPVGKTMILVIAITRDDGKPYVSDPYCVWQPSPGKFTRWPHKFLVPTHWMPLPESPQ